MEEISVLFREVLTPELQDIIISNSTNREIIHKVRVRPVMLGGQIRFQIEEFRGKQVFHKNHRAKEAAEETGAYLAGLFRQCEIRTLTEQIQVLVSKKGKTTVIRKKLGEGCRPAVPSDRKLSHNREKNYLLQEGKPVPFLVELGVMTEEGQVVKSKYDKFRQINRFLEFIADVLPALPKDRELTILDFGCGKSYLTFAIYHYLAVEQGYMVHIIGLDLKHDVIERCSGLAGRLGYERLEFLYGDIADYEGVSRVDMVVTLHACDTATDYALAKAVKWGAAVILSVPCCQHELNKQIVCGTLEPVLKYGLIKERIAALVTDALRAELLETAGYQTQILEFIDMEHTPKNILIRAVRDSGLRGEGGRAELDACMRFLQVEPALDSLL